MSAEDRGATADHGAIADGATGAGATGAGAIGDGAIGDPGTVVVREAADEELAAVGALPVAAYDRVVRISGPYRAELADPGARRGPGTRCLVAVADRRVVGAVTFTDGDSPHHEWAAAGDCGFRMLAVDPAAQGRGAGAALVDACLGLARGRDRMVITSMAAMWAAHRIYQRRGFVRRPDLDVRFGSGTGVVFSLDLAPDATDRWPGPGSVPLRPRWYEDVWSAGDEPGCA